VVELLYWFFAMALTCLALDLAWRLVSRVGDWFARGLSRPSEHDEPWDAPHITSLHRALCCASMYGGTASMPTARFLSPTGRRALGDSR
jgi:hypothetical protein